MCQGTFGERRAHDEVHVVFGTGPVGLAVMRELHGQGKRVRLVNRSGAAAAPLSVEVVKGNAADQAFTRQVCQDATVVYNCVNAPYTDWAELFPPMHAAILQGATANAKLNESFVMDSSKFVQAFGDIATSQHEAVRHTLEWYRLRAQTKAA
jgi:siroheme synthase (precorrin-2 oxidase/ferrochelatase)